MAWESFKPQPVIGVDEVGRGCLAGRVYAAAVILVPNPSHTDSKLEYTDSKLLSEKRREALAREICERHRVAIAFATVEEIARLNILWASLLAMKRAIEALGVTQGHVLLDGNQVIRDLAASYRQTAIVKGDLRAAPISAASIVAKVTRDLYAKTTLHEAYPQYGFGIHKGYATPEHRAALREHGPCREHRRTFAGVRELLPPLALSRSDRGVYSEAVVAVELSRRGFRFVAHRLRTPFAEIDLIFHQERPPACEWVVEVKALSAWERAPLSVSARQKARLRRAVLYRAQDTLPVRSLLALVTREQRVIFVPDFL